MKHRERYYTTEQEFYTLLKEILRHKGVTQRKMAADLNCSTQHLSRVLAGKGRMSANMLFRIIQYLDVEIVFLP